MDTDEFAVSIVNSGETTARDAQATYRVVISDEKNNVLWSELKTERLGDLKPTAEPIRLSIAVFGGISDEHLDLIHNEKAFVIFSGSVYYRDAYLPERRITGGKYAWKVEEDPIDLGEGQYAYPEISEWKEVHGADSNYST